MRQIQILVPDDQRDTVTEVLDEEGVDYVRHRAWGNDEEQWLVEFPVPTDAIGYVLDQLAEAGVDENQYTVVTSVETAMTPQVEPLRERFASDFDPLTDDELRAKVLDLSRDTRSFLAMVFLSAVIATAGLLVESSAVIVGSMVIAPIVGPVLTAAVGATTGDREMLLHSIWLQGAGLAVAMLGAWAFSVGLQFSGFVPGTLDVTSIDTIVLRFAPGILTVTVGLAAGAAGAYGLATKGPTSLIGVMIAAALIPAAATVGIAAAWTEPRIAVGSLLLLVLTMVLINLGAFGVLWTFGYRPGERGWLVGSGPSGQQFAVVVTALALLAVVAGTGLASYQQIDFERTINEEVETILDDPEYESVELVAVRIQYGGPGSFGSPETITLTVSRTAGGEPPQIAGEIDRRITSATGHDVQIRVRFVEYQRSDDAEPSRAVDYREPNSYPMQDPLNPGYRTANR